MIPFNDARATDTYGNNNSRGIHFTVPAGKTAYMINVEANTSKNHEVEVMVMWRGDTAGGFIILGEQSIYQNSIVLDKTQAPLTFVEKADIKAAARSNNTAVAVNFVYTFLLVDNQ